ncbi:MAG: site-specific DNA-methyltransferase [Eubacteriales bacterium]
MDKLRMQTANKADENFRALAAMFPNAVTETIDENGEVVRAIDKDVLMQEISVKVVEGKDERYQFTWPDKKKSVLLANAPISKTLRPCREESVDFDTTENLYIEGDNLEVLKLLQETYLGKIKVIYIDPPYNTGSDFVYEDDFAQSAEEYLAISGQLDDEGNRLFQNSDSNGRFHTDWLNMLYPRIKIAKDLLKDDGFIFISIDDNEIGSLLKVCDEIFGKNCFVGNVCRATGTTTAQGTDSLGKSFDYVVIYSKTPNFSVGGLELDEKDVARYNLEDERGKFSILQLRRTGGEDRREDRPSMYFGIETPDGKVVYPKGPTGYDSRWRVGRETYEKMLKNNEIYFKPDKDGYGVYYKFYLEGRTKRPSNLWNDIEGNKKAQIDLKALIPEKVFETPKPIELIKRIIQISNATQDDIVLDFFSGSATTAQAVMQLNSVDNGKRKFILVQLPEETDKTTEAYKAGYKTICDIGKERIRRAGAKIKEEAGFTAQGLDVGFRVLKCDTSNMKEVFYKPDEVEQTLFDNYANNIKEDRTPEDLLFQVMLDLGVLLSSKIEETTIAGCKVFNVAEGFLYACFDNNISDEVVTAIAKEQPYYAVFRDSGMASDSVLTNFDQIFASISPTTVRKVL